MELEGGVEPGGTVATLPHIGGLDGLRALAVLSVMAYHNGFAWLPGGFYGVDAFFVLSGYLITSLLVAEWRGTGRVRLGHFWARRARRLLPALFVLVTVLAVVHLAWPWVLPWPDPLGDAGATLGYVANWHFVWGNTGYFAASGPQSPLLHTWSLAIEEQFYLLWPLLVVLALGGLVRVLGRRRRASDGVARTVPRRQRRLVALAVVCTLGAFGSAAWMWLLTPQFANLNRAYYGTDTRAQALLVGAALAVALAAAPAPSAAVRRVMGAAGLVGLVAAAAVWHFVAFYSTLAFHGGFLVASVASASVVAAVVVAPGGLTGRVLSLRPLRYLGRISYGMYLWHWPLTLSISAARTHLDVWGLFACRTAATLVISALSFHFLEMPIRRGTVPTRRALIGGPVAVGLSLTLLAVAPTASLAAVPVRVVHPKDVAAPSGPPVRVMVVGDSMAGSLGAALAPEAPAYGVQIINEGHPGCAVTTDEEFRVLVYLAPPGAPCLTGQPAALLDKWRQWVDEYRPQVVVYLARVDLVDQEFDGAFTSIDDPSFDAYFRSQLDAGVSVLSSRGARVVFMTSPSYDSTLSSGGTVPEDAPARVEMDDTILRQVADARPDVTVFPLGTIVSPHGYQQDVDGVDIRCQDGVHLSATAGEVLGPRLLPLLVRLGHAARLTDVPLSTTSTTPAPSPPAVPAWYQKLPCTGAF